jgi:hypothetical protein
MAKISAIAVCAAFSGALISTSAQAVVTTFASFSPLAGGSNVRWQNSDGAANGTGGSFYSIGSWSSTAAAARAVSFSFFQPSLASQVNGVTALFSMNAAAPSGNGVSLNNNVLTQGGTAGSMSFISTSAITINDRVYAAGSNLLTATFGNSSIAGARLGTTASFTGSDGAGDNVVFSSDFLDFTNAFDSDFNIAMTGVFSGLQATPTGASPNSALRTFRATAGGSFSTDMGDVVPPLPEPDSWALMVIGLGLVGTSLRRKARLPEITA